MEYTVNGINISYETSGDKTWGDDRVLLEHAVDLTASTTWHAKGFTIEPFLDAESFKLFKQQTRALLLEGWSKAGLAPADDLQRRKAKLVNHSEVLFGLSQDFLAWVLLEAKQNFEEGRRR